MTVVELVGALFVAGLLVAIGLPSLLSTLDRWRAGRAAAYVAGEMTLAKAKAVQTSAVVGLVFDSVDGAYRVTRYVDRDGDGLRREDIARGTDVHDGVVAGSLAGSFRSRIAVRPDLPAIPGSGPPGRDPVHFGSSDILSFSPSVPPRPEPCISWEREAISTQSAYWVQPAGCEFCDSKSGQGGGHRGEGSLLPKVGLVHSPRVARTGSDYPGVRRKGGGRELESAFSGIGPASNGLVSDL